MTDYTITTNFGAKDSLPSGNAGKVIKGSEFTTEFTNIQTAVNSKADTAGDTFTGVVNFSDDVAVNTNTLFVDVSTAKVGIGTTTPDVALDIERTNATDNSNVPTLRFTDNDTSSLAGQKSGQIEFFSNDNNPDSAGVHSFINGQTENNSGYGALVFGTGQTGSSAERLRIDSLGNVGIGTDNPQRKLHVESEVRIQGTYPKLEFHDTDNNPKFTLIGGNAQLQFYDETNAATRMSITASGNIGIGTTSPARELSIGDGTGSPNIQLLAASSGNSRIEFGDTDDSDAGEIQYVHSTNYMQFTTNGTERLRIDSSGKVGIGTTTPDQKLQVDGNIRLGDTASGVDDDEDYGLITGGQLTIHANDSGDNVNYTGLVFDVGNASGAQAASSRVIFKVNNTERMRIDASGNVGIGTSSPDVKLHIDNGATSNLITQVFGGGTIYSGVGVDGTGAILTAGSSGSADASMIFRTASSGSEAERMRIDASGNVLVGTTSLAVADQTGSTTGVRIADVGNIQAASQATAAYFNRLDSDGTIIDLRRDGANVGSIGVKDSDIYIGKDAVGLSFDATGDDGIRPFHTGSKAYRDNAIDLGSSTARFDDIYATNGTINTSDRNEKQSIRELLDAEQRVATACKGLLRAFKWNSAVEEKGDEARIHFGIIAQDLQDAFTAEGLDAGDYAMFINTTWTDEETGEERSRMGVRYSELLAFIISAI